MGNLLFWRSKSNLNSESEFSTTTSVNSQENPINVEPEEKIQEPSSFETPAGDVLSNEVENLSLKFEFPELHEFITVEFCISYCSMIKGTRLYYEYKNLHPNTNFPYSPKQFYAQLDELGIPRTRGKTPVYVYLYRKNAE